MIDVFPAVNDVYRSHPKLREHGRVLVEGDVSREHPPFTLLAGSLIREEATPSTFGTDGVGLDVEIWELIFTLWGKSFTPGSVRAWMEAMVDAYESAEIIDPFFKSVSSHVVGKDGPLRESEIYRATSTVELTIQYDSIRPRVRY